MPLSSLIVMTLSAFCAKDCSRRARPKRGGGEDPREIKGFARGGSILGRNMVDSGVKIQLGKDLGQIGN
jgi:hypothetical protein